jgi:hypothetical protein
MRDALSAPFLVAALVLCGAGVAKLRAPGPARRALIDAGLPGGAALVRPFAGGELALGSWSLLAPGRAAAVSLSLVYLMFAVLAALLARRASSCGCFGSTDAPATWGQSVLSVVIGLLCAAAAGLQVRGISWALHRPPAVAAVLLFGLAGGAYATVVAYTELPAAWSSWSRA